MAKLIGRHFHGSQAWKVFRLRLRKGNCGCPPSVRRGGPRSRGHCRQGTELWFWGNQPECPFACRGFALLLCSSIPSIHQEFSMRRSPVHSRTLAPFLLFALVPAVTVSWLRAQGAAPASSALSIPQAQLVQPEDLVRILKNSE